MSRKVTDGRDYLGEFAPQFAAINDDILFGEVWSREDALPPHDRSLITVAALMGAGILDTSLRGHMERAKANGVTKAEMVEIITQLAFYTGWPKAWEAFAQAMEVYKEQEEVAPEALFGLGEAVQDEVHFTGRVWVKEIAGFEKPTLADSVTFAPGCINAWHIHKAGQTLLVTNGRGWYQEAGKPAQALRAGDIVDIPAGVKHWHGAACDSYFTHLALEDWSKGAPEWLEKVDLAVYTALGKDERA